MAKSPNWTLKELEIIQIQYPLLGSGVELQTLLPGRSSKSISVKASRLGLKVEFSRKWEPFELELLKKNYPIYGTVGDWVLSVPSRSPESIRIHARRLGIPCGTLAGKLKPLHVYLDELNVLGMEILEQYNGGHTPILHKHTYCGHTWKVSPGNLIGGSGCPRCSRKLPFSYEVGYLYLLKITSPVESFLKVGVTSKDISFRCKAIIKELGDSYDVEVIKVLKGTGESVYALEKDIYVSSTLIRYKSIRKFGGCTELYNLTEQELLLEIMEQNDNKNL